MEQDGSVKRGVDYLIKQLSQSRAQYNWFAFSEDRAFFVQKSLGISLLVFALIRFKPYIFTMSLTDSQKTAVSTWIAEGKSLADVQRLLREEFSISMTYMEVRFLVDDLDIAFAEPEPEAAEEVRRAGRRPLKLVETAAAYWSDSRCGSDPATRRIGQWLGRL